MDNASKVTVLLVEDDHILSKMYTEKLNMEGFTVVSANDGEEALKKVNDNSINFILLDIMMPRLSGLDFLELLRNTDKGKSIPVITLTNLAENREKQKALSLGAKEYLIKAMQTPEDVVNKVKKYLGLVKT